MKTISGRITGESKRKSAQFMKHKCFFAKGTLGEIMKYEV